MIVHAPAATRLDVAGAATALIDIAPNRPADPVTGSRVPG